MKSFASIMGIAALTWSGLWFTPDQQGQRMFDRGEFASAAQSFRDPLRQGVAWFRAGEYERAEQAFARVDSPQAEYNRGNCLIMRGKYNAAVERFDLALRQHPDWDDAIVNRGIAVARAKMLEQTGGDMGDQTLGADEIRFDKNASKEGQDTEVSEQQVMSNSEMQALWLRRVQTKPADFLKAKFAFQLADDQSGVQ